MSLRIIGAALALCGALLAGGAHAADVPVPEGPPGGYELGRGLRLGDSGVTLGGYATAEFRSLQGTHEQLKSSHASAFVWWEGLERAKVFAEFDLENLISHRSDGRDNDHDGDNDRRLSVERLYLDLAFSDAFTGRIGKFLTPIGRWNLVHADPLVWTTTRPLLTQSVVPRNVTGLMASGSLPWVSYSVYASNGTELDADPYQDLFSRVRGLRLVLPAGRGVELGLSLARYSQRSARAQTRSLAGVDILWTVNRCEFSAEWLRSGGGIGPDYLEPRQHDDGPPLPAVQDNVGTTRGSYLQAVLPLVGELFVVGRMEWLRDARAVTTARQSVLGLAWRVNPATSLKAEIVRPGGAINALPKGFVASVSVLF